VTKIGNNTYMYTGATAKKEAGEDKDTTEDEEEDLGDSILLVRSSEDVAEGVEDEEDAYDEDFMDEVKYTKTRFYYRRESDAYVGESRP
jgi:hypothetical protein